MRVFGIVFLLVFVPESVVVQGISSAFNSPKTKFGFREALRQAWTDKAGNFNFLQILTSRSRENSRTRRNLIALASINTIMFGAFMGAMNVMLLYSEVSRFFVLPMVILVVSYEIRIIFTDKSSMFLIGVTKKVASSSQPSTSSGPSLLCSSYPWVSVSYADTVSRLQSPQADMLVDSTLWTFSSSESPYFRT